MFCEEGDVEAIVVTCLSERNIVEQELALDCRSMNREPFSKYVCPIAFEIGSYDISLSLVIYAMTISSWKNSMTSQNPSDRDFVKGMRTC
jgi:hypothetical protein